MLYKSTKKYIFNESKKYNVAIPDNYEDVLNEYCKIAKDWGYTLIFKSGRGNDSDKLGANAGLFYSSPIIATPEWAARLILSKFWQNTPTSIGGEMNA